ncbi:MAG: CopG family transcriptional regulator [Colwellia sp.]|nr:CopG family transcriptional regulator [Colwellia sp.]
MQRQSLSLTEKMICGYESTEYVGDYANKSELVNDLISRARKAEVINKKLERAEINEFTEQSPQDMLDEFKLLLLQINTFQFN